MSLANTNKKAGAPARDRQHAVAAAAAFPCPLQLDLPLPQLIRHLTTVFQHEGLPAPQSEAEWLLAGLLKIKRSALYEDHDRCLTLPQQQTAREFVHRRLQREPLPYILRSWEFYGLKFEVNPAVLIPRPETELLVEKVIALARPRAGARILDLGTGSGCIAITLAAHLPQAQIVALDNSAAALATARRNAQRHQMAARLDFRLADMCDPGAFSAGEQFDFVVSNPPYILWKERDTLQPEIREYEPATALFVQEGLEYYRCIVTFCQTHLAAGGWVACEMASPRHAQIAALFREGHFAKLEILTDYAGRPRHVIAQTQNGGSG
ncbi:MAG: peptide chain release factor N(5)-glutamine methyltransferase [candidate division KSB1 bacterium]|nr:peptide chain release factor N(5)-glutamine methyltransferase [candidate division KSB1 bacterium]MDZ7298523.1 peptide chain release factor N(5)-glutamine methyltransferase [candidate division KSB1 bacterium]MDZ7306253.1 peptide chain release factor N(5)-glutamine methyltransferase [candidate division KSB1 bacterium]